jgi:hypothetical protein
MMRSLFVGLRRPYLIGICGEARGGEGRGGEEKQVIGERRLASCCQQSFWKGGNW